jgi:four helix bundle protein
MLEGIRKIKAWELSDKLVLLVYKVTRSFPRNEMYGLVSQMRRAAVSVPANIVEGAQRRYLKEYLQFLYTAKSSLAEVEYYIYLSYRLEYVTDKEYEELSTLQAEAARTLQGLIRWLEKQIEAGKVTKQDLRK